LITGEQLRKARQDMKYTQRRLGELVGMQGRSAETVVQKWEYGDILVPVSRRAAVARLLELPPDAFRS
jgi:transcriptional regulator with XRE-family HTH domain